MIQLSSLLLLAFASVVLACCSNENPSTRAVDLVADIIVHAADGAEAVGEGPYQWKREGDTLAVRAENFWNIVKVTANKPCVYTIEFKRKYESKPVVESELVVDFTKVKKLSNLPILNSPTPNSSAVIVLEGDAGFYCWNKNYCREKKVQHSNAPKIVMDRAVTSFEEFRTNYCPAAKAIEVVGAPAQPVRLQDAKKDGPSLQDMQKWADSRLKTAAPVDVKSSSCRTVGEREWECDVVYETFINDSTQLMLAGYYENSITGVWGIQDFQLKIVRNYRLVGQRRISLGSR